MNAKSTSRRRFLLFFVMPVLLLPVLLVAVVLWNAFSQQIQDSYQKRLVTSLGVLELGINHEVESFRLSMSRLAADNTLQITVDLDIRPQLKRYLRAQFDVSEYRFLKVSDIQGKVLVDVGNTGSGQSCTGNADSRTELLEAIGGDLVLHRSLPLYSKRRLLGYLCGALTVNGKKSVTAVVERIDGTAQLVYHGEVFAYGAETIDKHAPKKLNTLFRREARGTEYLGMASEWPLNKDVLMLEVLVDMQEYQAFFRRSVETIGVVALAILVITGFALRSLGMRHRAEEALLAEREKAVVTLASIADGVLSLDAQGLVTYANSAAEKLLGKPEEEMRGQHWGAIFGLRSDGKTMADLDLDQHLRAGEGELFTDPVLVTRDGTEIAVHLSVAPIRHNEPYSGAVIVLRDVHKERELRRRLAWKASRDELTGLLNRSEFRRSLELAIDAICDSETNHCLLFIDLDEFKVVNDTCGHKAGDDLLRQVSASLLSQLRETDVFARLGGDEFGILLRNCPLEKGRTLANELVEVINDNRFTFGEKVFHVGASIGLVPVNHHTRNIEDLLASVDAACYAAKEEGKNRVFVGQVDSEKISYRMEELRQASHIRHALKEDRFVLFFQPIVSVENPGQVVHSEILVRMVDEKGELVVPGAFIGTAERHGLMQDIDRWIIRRLFELEGDRLRGSQTESNRLGGRRFLYSINLSGSSLTDTGFLEFVQGELRKHGIPGASIAFEITETQVITHLDHAAELIRALKGLGCSFLLDDFGSGMSSFGYLKRLPVDYLKIDGSFVKDVTFDPIDRSMVKMINEIGHIMGLETIAEYVESSEIMAFLREIGVDMAQGYVIAEPKPLETNPGISGKSLP